MIISRDKQPSIANRSQIEEGPLHRFHRLAGAAGLVMLALDASAETARSGNPLHAELCLARAPKLTHSYARLAVLHVAVADPAAISHEDQAEFLFKLGLLEGHLAIGKALLDINQPRAALPHFGHPVRELYNDIHESLPARGLADFDTDLIALEAMAAAKPTDPATAAKFDAVMRIVAAARATVPEALRNTENFMLGVLGDIMETAAEDYSEAIERGRIEKPVEYHDSRGYLLYAASEMARLEAMPALASDARLHAFHRQLVQAQAIVGPLLPPERPLKSVADFKAIVAAAKTIAKA
jgi:hypothetical protein